MGPTVLIGIAAAIFAFLVVGTIWSNLIEQSMSGMVAITAAGFVFKYFWDKDKKELAALLNPPDQVWPVPYPIAWGCIIDVLKRSGVETGVSGRSVWQVMQEDDSRGFIQAKLVFNQLLGAGEHKSTVTREIHLVVQLAAEETTTRLHFEYQMLSPSGAGVARELIKKNQDDFRTYMESNRIQ